ncbi:MAG: ABC transporter permease [Candidatus Aminicenantes bacterium]|nr:ABC transporter permease [Candidatus Aminicenantes bacterium]
MIWNFLKLAWRNLRKQKIFSIINLVGLSLGLACFILLYAYVRDEFLFDRFHAKADNIYLVTYEMGDKFVGGSHHIVAEKLKTDFQEVQTAVRMSEMTLPVRYGSHIFNQEVVFADPGFFELFTYPLKLGNPAHAIDTPDKIALSREAALRFFGETDPLGRVLSVKLGGKNRSYVVSAVMEAFPGHSSIRLDALMNFQNMFPAYGVEVRDTYDFVTLPLNTNTFLEIPNKEQAASLRAKLPALHEYLYGAMYRKYNIPEPKRGIDLIGFTDYHLGEVDAGLEPRSQRVYSLILTGIAFLVLMLACFNYMNLSLARYTGRVKEIGVRKVIGAGYGQLIRQFLIDSLIVTFLSLFLALLMAVFLLPRFNMLAAKNIALADLFNIPTLTAFIGLTLIVGMASGGYPAFVLARLDITEILKGKARWGKKNPITQGLMLMQFAVSIFFLIGTSLMTSQLRFLHNKDLGYNKEGLVVIDAQIQDEQSQEGQEILDFIKNECLGHPGILSVTGDAGILGYTYRHLTRRYIQDGRKKEVADFMIGYDYFKTLGVSVYQGRDFSSSLPTDSKDTVIINQALASEFQLEDPVGRRFSEFASDVNPPGLEFDPLIIGVVPDFHVRSLHDDISPMMFELSGWPPVLRIRNILVRLQPEDISASLEFIKTRWEQIRPDIPILYYFLDDALAEQYLGEKNWSRILGYAAALALLIACMGLYGLSVISVSKRTKEVGIRKILGARISSILLLLSREFVILIGLANIIAWPLAYYSGERWLRGFAFRVGIEILPFLLASSLVLCVALATIGAHIVRTARDNPIKALRFE